MIIQKCSHVAFMASELGSTSLRAALEGSSYTCLYMYVISLKVESLS